MGVQLRGRAFDYRITPTLLLLSLISSHLLTGTFKNYDNMIFLGEVKVLVFISKQSYDTWGLEKEE